MGSSALSLTLLLMSSIHSGLTQDSPKSTLTVTPNTVFTGERVILTCEIESDQSDWRYEWRRGDTYYTSDSQLPERYTVKENTLTVEGSESSDEGQYTCRGHIDGYFSSQSNSVSLSVKDLPKPQLTVDPESPVFTGERVSLKCVIESYSYWTYEWWKDRDSVKNSYTVNTHTLTISGATKSDEGQYTCKVQRHGSPSSSQESNRIYLAVNDLPRSTLTVTPDNTVFTGERVILKCEIESDRDWRYEWRKGNSNIQVSQRYTVERNTLTVEGSESSDEGQYTCRGHIEGRSVSSQSSSAVSLSVKERPKTVVKVSPDQRVFRGETVTLTCDIQRGDIQWIYSWFKDGYTRYPYTKTTTAELSFTASVSSSGEYSCRGERSDSQTSHTSAALTLTVSAFPRSTLTVTPDNTVFTGERVILTCEIESDHRDWRYEWNKDSVKLQSSDRYTVNTDTLTIRAVTTSDEGQYTCRGQRDERPNSSQESEPINLSVNVSAASSSLLVTGVVVGSSVCLLFFLSLLLMWRYKKNKDQQRNINQTSVPNQSAQSHLENFPLQSEQPQ